jgi:hypothetical protein
MISTVTVATSTQYTYSIFAKADQLNFVALRGLSFTTPANGGVWFDLSTGSVGTETAGFTGQIESIGNGWYRCSIVFTTDASDTSGNIGHYAASADNNNLLEDLDGTSSILIYGAQLEAGSTPSSYIPNAGTSGGVTRAAETLTVPAAQLPWPEPNVIGPELAPQDTSTTEGWLVSEVAPASITGTAQGLRILSPAAEFCSVGLSAVVGKVYKVVFTLEVVAGQCEFRNGSVSAVYVVGTHEVDLEVLPEGAGLLRWARAGSTTDAYLRNVSVKEIDPLSVSIQMDGRMTYADEGVASNIRYLSWVADASNFIIQDLYTSSGYTGAVYFQQRALGVTDFVTLNNPGSYSPGILVPYNIASRHGSTFINGATDGTALTANTTPTALPDLSTTDLNLAYNFMGTIRTFRMWDVDLGDDGIEEASTPEAPDIPANAITQRDGSYILDRSGSYIETRA